LKSLCVCGALSLGVALFVGLLWESGALASLDAVFVRARGGDTVTQPQAWLGLVLIATAGFSAGFAIERAGARRTAPWLVISPALLCVLSFLVSYLVGIDILCAPMTLSMTGTALMVQAWRLWDIDASLTRSLGRADLAASGLEGGAASARLMGGLKLLDTVLPLNEAVIFRLEDGDALAPASRLRPTAKNGTLGDRGDSAASGELNRNSVWREGLSLCERAIRTNGIVISPITGGLPASTPPRDKGRPAETATVALPLQHEEQVVGALLLRLREAYDEADRPLLTAVGAQLARDLQREEARLRPAPRDSATLFSVGAAKHRLASFGVLSGLFAEQSFAAHVLAEAVDGYAIAYLDGTIAYFNTPMLRAAQLTEEEARALDLFGLLDRFRTGVFDEPSIAVRRVLQTGHPYERELSITNRDQTVELRIALVVNRETGQNNSNTPQPLCLAVTARDVTRTKEYEKLKSDMIALMSHELRTPITSINGFAELLALDETLPDETREFLTIIHSESQRLTRMVNTFLSVTKLKATDRQEMFKVPLLLVDVVRETVTNLQPMAKKRRIRLVEKDGAKLPPIAADRSLITQAVANLVENAIKYSPERTAVQISTALEADAVRLTVEDRGYGIPPEAIDRVWEKFYRVARDGHDKEEESTGLGLSFVREVVEQHGGSVALESEVGRGSKFSFTLPRL